MVRKLQRGIVFLSKGQRITNPQCSEINPSEESASDKGIESGGNHPASAVNSQGFVFVPESADSFLPKRPLYEVF